MSLGHTPRRETDHLRQQGDTSMATTTDGKYRRVQLDFSEEAFNDLNELQKKLNASSRAEVIRNALGILRWATNHLLKGNKIKVERKDERELVEVEFPFLLIK